MSVACGVTAWSILSGHMVGSLCFRDLVLPDGNRVSAFSVASTAIAAAQWSSTQVRWPSPAVPALEALGRF